MQEKDRENQRPDPPVTRISAVHLTREAEPTEAESAAEKSWMQRHRAHTRIKVPSTISKFCIIHCLPAALRNFFFTHCILEYTQVLESSSRPKPLP